MQNLERRVMKQKAALISYLSLDNAFKSRPVEQVLEKAIDVIRAHMLEQERIAKQEAFF